VAHLSRWLTDEGLDVGDLCLEKVVRFLQVRRSAGYSELLSVQALTPFLNHLRNLKIIPDEIPTQSHEPMELLLDRFRNYLETERGLGHIKENKYSRQQLSRPRSICNKAPQLSQIKKPECFYHSGFGFNKIGNDS